MEVSRINGFIIQNVFRYDFSGIGVEVTENREALSSLLTRLAGILGGIFASSGIMSSIIAAIPHK